MTSVNFFFSCLITTLPSLCFENQSLHKQFKTLAEKILRDSALADNPKFATNDARVKNRIELVRLITDVLMQNDREYWLEQFTGLG
jgi:succinate--hydroxymethylglutarate CoA-transferase